MNTRPLSSFRRSYKPALLIALLLVTLALIKVNHTVETIEMRDQPKAMTQKSSTPAKVSSTVRSGKGAFTVTFPDGWGPIIRDTQSDVFIMSGMNQPTTKSGQNVDLKDVAGYGGDSASVLHIWMGDVSDASLPQGVKEDFTIGKGTDAVQGTKYIYVYPQDELAGIGYQRFAGDRDYAYVFSVKGKQLHVSYSVYGVDPRNQSADVDKLVQSIRF